jgi:hypothetical protein
MPLFSPDRLGAIAFLLAHGDWSGPLFSKGSIFGFGVVAAICLIYWLFKGRKSD